MFVKSFVLFLCLQNIQIRCQDFTYSGERGPSHWGEQYTACFGKHQSPINIDILNVQRSNFPRLEFKNFDIVHNKTALQNNGHTVLFTFESDKMPQVSGGPLADVYEYNQMHFHWGNNDSFGSENKIEGRSFPMELHMVFSKKDYEKPLEHDDGLAVLAFFFEISDNDNKNYKEFTDLLPKIREAHSSIHFENPVTLSNLVHANLQTYYTYNGSLTTPPCLEIVTWIDFQDPILLSHDQIEAFRNLEDDEGTLVKNFRPIQPLHDRIVFFNSNESLPPENSVDEKAKGAEDKNESNKNNKKKVKNSSAMTIINMKLILIFFALLKTL